MRREKKKNEKGNRAMVLTGERSTYVNSKKSEDVNSKSEDVHSIDNWDLPQYGKAWQGKMRRWEGEKEKRNDCGDELRFERQPRRGADWWKINLC